MDEPTPPRLRGAPLLAARGAALTLSIGVAVLLMVRAGVGGCRADDADVEPEARPGASAAEADFFPGSKADTKLVRRPAPSATASPGPYGVYFPGSKADPHIVREAPATPPAPSLAPPASADAPKPHFFPGTKAWAGDVDPDPPAGAGR
jgi:hypothetical protein